MKREIQERLYQETCDMNAAEFRDHLRRRIAQSRFSEVFVQSKPRKP